LASNSEHARLQFRRSGGIFAGNRLVLDVDQHRLHEEGAAALGRVLDGGGLARFARLPSRGVGADEYEYGLVVTRGEEVVSLRFDESRLPPDLAPLIHALERQAQATA
jgi:hypothetical protein